MKPRRSTVALLLGLCLTLTSLADPPSVVWTGEGVTPSVSDAGNWASGVPLANGTESFVFGDIDPLAFHSVVFPGFVDITLAVYSLDFTGTGPLNYTFSGTGLNPVLHVLNDLTMDTTGTVTFADSLPVMLSFSGSSVTVDAGGTVTVDGDISGDGGGGAILKYGAGTLVLGGDNTFGTGNSLTVHEGTLLIGASSTHVPVPFSIITSPVGRGTLILAENTTLGVVGPGPYILHNPVHLFSPNEGPVTIDLPSGASLELANTFTGSAGLLKTGAGTLTLSNDIYSASGGLTVDEGTLIFDVSISSLDPSTVNAGGTLAFKNNAYLGGSVTVNSGGGLIGQGTAIEGIIGSGGTLSPGFTDSLGDRIGYLNFYDLTLGQGSILEIDVKHLGSGNLAYDEIFVSTPTTLTITANLANPLTLKLISLNTAGQPGDLSSGLVENTLYSLNFLSYDDTIVGNLELGVNVVLDTSAFSTEAAYAVFNLVHNEATNNFYLTFVPVPEPSTYALMALGLGFIGLTVWRKSRRGF